MAAAMATASAAGVHLPSMGLYSNGAGRRLSGRALQADGHAIFTWYEGALCTTSRSRALLATDECQLSPGQEAEAYAVACDEGGEGGTVTFFSNGECSGDGDNTAFSNDECLVIGEGDAARALSVTCSADAVAGISPEDDEVAFTWYAADECMASGGGSLILARAGVCQHGYVVNCNEDGSGGTWDTGCSSPDDPFGCETCENSQPFENDECISNPSEFGSRSVAFSCEGLPRPPNDPDAEGGRTPPDATPTSSPEPTGITSPTVPPTSTSDNGASSAAVTGGIIAAMAVAAANLVR